MDDLNLSDCYHGVDELMRLVMRVAYEFEVWACTNVDFDQLGEVWPCFMEDSFGDACLRLVAPCAVNEWNASSCLRVAFVLRLPLRPGAATTGPVNVHALHPNPHAGFPKFRIQSIRHVVGLDAVEPFTFDDDPFDDRYGPTFFGLYGVGADGLLEHIADRDTFREAVSLAEKIAPGVCFENSQGRT